MDYTFESVEEERRAFLEDEKYQGTWLPVATIAKLKNMSGWAVQRLVEQGLVESVKLRKTALLIKLDSVIKE